MYPGLEPAAGEKVQLRGIVKSKNRPKINKNRRRHSYPVEQIDIPISTESEVTYKVEKGDTLYRIASHYQVSVESLRERNDLESNVIKPGQILYIGT